MSRSRSNCTCASSARTFAHGRLRVDRRQRGAGETRRAGGVDGRRRCRHSADRFSPHPDRRARALPPAAAWHRQGALCRRAGGRRFRGRSVSRRRCGRTRHARRRGIAGNSACRREPGEFEPGRRPSLRSSARAMAMSTRLFVPRTPWSRATLSIGRHSGVPLETRGAIARYDAARDMLELHGAAKVPHSNRDQIARMLGRAASTVHLYEGHVGGGFGIRGELYPEDILVCAAALRLRRPVKWIEDRGEHLIAANHSRQQHHHVRAAVDRDGRILALEDEIFHDQGAYIRTHAATVPDLAAAMLPGPYRVPAYRASVHIRLTNKTPCGTYRAPGRFESTFVRERLLDAIADKLDLDRVEVRRRNLIATHEMPYVRRARYARHRHRSRFRRLCGTARQGAGRNRMAATAGKAGCAPRRWRTRRCGSRAFRGKKRTWGRSIR